MSSAMLEKRRERMEVVAMRNPADAKKVATDSPPVAMCKKTRSNGKLKAMRGENEKKGWRRKSVMGGNGYACAFVFVD